MTGARRARRALRNSVLAHGHGPHGQRTATKRLTETGNWHALLSGTPQTRFRRAKLPGKEEEVKRDGGPAVGGVIAHTGTRHQSPVE
jgi:hypothetical protein